MIYCGYEGFIAKYVSGANRIYNFKGQNINSTNIRGTRGGPRNPETCRRNPTGNAWKSVILLTNKLKHMLYDVLNPLMTGVNKKKYIYIAGTYTFYDIA